MTNKLYVGNLSYETTEAQLSQLFASAGEVVSVSVVTDRMTGRSRGFAFVEMADQAGAQQAVTQINGKEIDGRALKVAEALPKREMDDRPPRRDGGGGRGGPRGGGGRDSRGGGRGDSRGGPRAPRW